MVQFIGREAKYRWHLKFSFSHSQVNVWLNCSGGNIWQNICFCFLSCLFQWCVWLHLHSVQRRRHFRILCVGLTFPVLSLSLLKMIYTKKKPRWHTVIDSDTDCSIRVSSWSHLFCSPLSGLIPRLLGDVLSLWICNLLAHLINTYAIDDSVGHFKYRPVLQASLKTVLVYSFS